MSDFEELVEYEILTDAEGPRVLGEEYVVLFGKIIRTQAGFHNRSPSADPADNLLSEDPELALM